jgi:1-aminocyclopropane-1-carboxylate deaminase/D-cysteine desulfhydrase-like pyridoxal-dependent ACC family enzyme
MTSDITPVEFRDGVWFKRDDLFEVVGVSGGKARTCWHLITSQDNPKGVVTAGSRMSPQVVIVGRMAHELGLPCRVHTPTGRLSKAIEGLKELGVEVIQHEHGYNNVIIARARDDAKELGWYNVPFGMECEEAVIQTSTQTINIPEEAKRLVVPVGSGMSLAGILTGLQNEDRFHLPVIGIVVGADPTDRLNRFGPDFWTDMSITLLRSEHDYHTPVNCTFKGVKLDPIYEAKCVPYLEEGDCFWIVGIRNFE